MRTLHHYDRLGLLSPGRDAAGRRRYGPAETRRLHQIIALRGFVELIERMITVDRKLSPEQLAELYQQRQQLLPADFPGPGPARNDHRRNAGRAARHKVRHEARGSVEHP